MQGSSTSVDKCLLFRTKPSAKRSVCIEDNPAYGVALSAPCKIEDNPAYGALPGAVSHLPRPVAILDLTSSADSQEAVYEVVY